MPYAESVLPSPSVDLSSAPPDALLAALGGIAGVVGGFLVAAALISEQTLAKSKYSAFPPLLGWRSG